MSPAIAGLRSPLHVEDEGHGTVLLMLHGGAGSVDDLAALRLRLARGRRLVLPEQRGHGRSTGEGEISYAAQAADTVALLDELDVGKVDVLGWSDGGIVALLVARDRPDLVDRVIAISANASMGSLPPPLMPETLEALSGFTPADLEIPAVRRVLPGAETAWPEVAGRIIEMWRAGPTMEVADLARLTSRVLYVAADHDIVTPEHTAAMFRATTDAEMAVVPGADHHLVQRRADEVAAIVEAFLGRAPHRG